MTPQPVEIVERFYAVLYESSRSRVTNGPYETYEEASAEVRRLLLDSHYALSSGQVVKRFTKVPV